MSECMNSVNFKHYFKENMESLGLPVPSSLFDSFNTAIATAAVIGEAVSLQGSHITLGQAIAAQSRMASLKIAAGISASFYVGAVIGSIAVATGRSLSCGASIADALAIARTNGIYGMWLEYEFVRHPKLLQAQV